MEYLSLSLAQVALRLKNSPTLSLLIASQNGNDAVPERCIHGILQSFQKLCRVLPRKGYAEALEMRLVACGLALVAFARQLEA